MIGLDDYERFEETNENLEKYIIIYILLNIIIFITLSCKQKNCEKQVVSFHIFFYKYFLISNFLVPTNENKYSRHSLNFSTEIAFDAKSPVTDQLY